MAMLRNISKRMFIVLGKRILGVSYVDRLNYHIIGVSNLQSQKACSCSIKSLEPSDEERPVNGTATV